jgi:ubiquinone/menaquinone biosynthesis C-methylase UbiE
MDKNILAAMRGDWDQRARDNAEHYIENSKESWDDREFFRSGEVHVANHVMPDMHRICGGSRSPLDLTVLEVGCGVGRMTRMLCRIFGHVTAVDVSKEMIDRASTNLADVKNLSLSVCDGATLTEIRDASHDFAFSFIVFQHIPSIEVIGSYCDEVYRVLRPGSLFNFQVNGCLPALNDHHTADTWMGVPVSEEDAHDLARSAGFLHEGTHGAGTHYFWLSFRKPWT